MDIAVKVLLTILLLGGAIIMLKRSDDKIPDNEIRQPSICKNVGIGGIIIYTSLALFLLYQEGLNSEGIAYFSILFSLNTLNICLILLFYNYRIVCFEEYFLYRNVFGKEKQYFYRKISIKTKKTSYRIYDISNRLIVNISILQPNCTQVIQKIKQRRDQE